MKKGGSILFLYFIFQTFVLSSNPLILDNIPVNATLSALQSGSAGIPVPLLNPASISLMKYNKLTLTYCSYYFDLSYISLEAMMKIKKYNIGLSALYFNYGDVENYDINLNQTEEVNAGYSSLISFHIAKKIFQNIITGATAKFITEKLGTTQGNAYALDLGLLKKNLFYKNLNISLIVKNLGINAKFRDTRENIPITITSGLSYIIIPRKSDLKLQILSDFSYRNNNIYSLNTGINLRYSLLYKIITIIRVGFSYPINQDIISSFSAGCGIIYNRFILNYSFNPGNYLGAIHRVTIGIIF